MLDSYERRNTQNVPTENMTSKYAVELDIPNAFPEILKVFTREVLRATTYEQMSGTEEEIYTFAAQYFKKMAAAKSSSSLNQSTAKHPASETSKVGSMFDKLLQYQGAKMKAEGVLVYGKTKAELQAWMKQIFNSADLNTDGVLQKEEFYMLMRGTGVVEDEDIDVLFDYCGLADDKGNLVVDFSSLEPVVYDLVVDSMARKILENHGATRQSNEYRKKAQDAMLIMDAKELEAKLMAIFLEADSNGDGTVQLEELYFALENMGLGLPMEDVLELMGSANDSEDAGPLDYRQFCPIAHEILLQYYKKRIGDFDRPE